MYDYDSDDAFMDDGDEEFIYSEDESPVSEELTQTQYSQAPAQSQLGYSADAAFDDFDYFGGETGDFEPTENQLKARKPWEVDFKIYDPKELRAKQEAIVARIEPLLATTKDAATLLLRCYFWKEEPLVEDYLSDPDRTMTKAGISTKPFKPCIETGDRDFECKICFCSGADESYLALSCGHRFCTTCYATYVSGKVQEGGSWRIHCPAPKCNILVGQEGARMLLADDPESLERYNTNLTRSFVNDRDSLVWCPAPNCEYAIECNAPKSTFSSTIPTVTCRCENVFCFACQLPDHSPAPCLIADKWLEKCKDDSETSSWIKVNTKECTKCKATIEKNGGCNHMSCRECKYEFCWVCMGPWSEHGQQFYNCNRFNEESSKKSRGEISETRAQLERYIHYFTRFNNHEQSAKLARRLLVTTEKNMEQLQRELGLSWIEVQFLSDAVDILSLCRSTLKWTYALAFYMKATNQMEIFKENQSDLESATEQLNDLVENPTAHGSIEDIKRKIIDKSTYVKSRRETLLSDIALGLQENRWEFVI